MSKNKKEFATLQQHTGHLIEVYIDQYGSDTIENEGVIRCITCGKTLAAAQPNTPLYNRILSHQPEEEHSIVCVSYGIKNKPAANVSIECETCDTVIFDMDRDFTPEEEPT